MKRDPFEGAVIIDRIRWFVKKVDTILSIIEEKTSLKNDEIALAQHHLKQFKERLAADQAFMSHVEHKHSSSADLETYCAAIHQAHSEFEPRTNSNPIRSKWDEHLWHARDTLTYYYQDHLDQ